MAGWASAFGVQLFGTGELLAPGTPDWEFGITIFKYPASNWEVGRPIDTVRRVCCSGYVPIASR